MQDKHAETTIDLLLWDGGHNTGPALPAWALGRVMRLPELVQEGSAALEAWAKSSTAGWGLLWSPNLPFPSQETLLNMASSGVDIAHCGLLQGRGALLDDLFTISNSWQLINPPAQHACTSWKLGLESCLLRRDIVVRLGGLDKAFTSMEGAGLEFGQRCMILGALVEHHPELVAAGGAGATTAGYSRQTIPPLPSEDVYSFVLRFWGPSWARYLALRRGLKKRSFRRELRALASAVQACRPLKMPTDRWEPVWYGDEDVSRQRVGEASVSVIVPTLGRYSYVGKAIASLREQTVRPHEVIVVDQNPADERQPEVYEGFEDLNLRVIWQDRQGQSLARNGGLAEAVGEYAFLFDDDSIAFPDLIEKHLRNILGGRFDASTGVSYPPPPSEYTLPARFRYPKVATTFDTGNSLLPLRLARQVGGLDRNFDFGPGTDMDFGTRLYLAGHRIVLTPDAVRIHYKAPMGGLRTHGAKKYNTDAGMLAPFPPVTQSYYCLRYITNSQRRERSMLLFTTSKLGEDLRRPAGGSAGKLKSFLGFGFALLLLPVKIVRSRAAAQKLLRSGVQLASFPVPDDQIEAAVYRSAVMATQNVPALNTELSTGNANPDLVSRYGG